MPENVISIPAAASFELRFHFSVFLARYFIAGRKTLVVKQTVLNAPVVLCVLFCG